jgi:hypothetical protein
MIGRIRNTAAVLLAAVIVAACSDVTQPLNPADALTQRGNGSPHFVLDDTSCDGGPEGITCSFKVAGLANNGQVTVKLEAHGEIVYSCTNPGGESPPAWQNKSEDWAASVTLSAVRSGNVTGTLSVGPEGADPSDLCPAANWTVDVHQSDVSGVTLSATGATGAGGFSLSFDL